MVRSDRPVWLEGGTIAAISIRLHAAHAAAHSRLLAGPRGAIRGRSVGHNNSVGDNLLRSAAITRPNDQTATREFSPSVSNGTISDNRSFAGFNCATTQRTFTRTPGQDGTAAYTDPAGQTRNHSYAP